VNYQSINRLNIYRVHTATSHNLSRTKNTKFVITSPNVKQSMKIPSTANLQ